MGDGLKLSKDKRHRSSSSLAGVTIEGTRSERKLDIRASIPEVDDQFAIAEARCDDLQEKIDLVKTLKRKRKLKKRSTTRVNSEQQSLSENIPFIAVRTQPKKKVTQQAARLRRIEIPPNPVRGYLDPAMLEQHRMIGQMHGYNQNYRRPQYTKTKQSNADSKSPTKSRSGRARADGDSMYGTQCSGEVRSNTYGDEGLADFSDNDSSVHQQEDFQRPYYLGNKKPAELQHQIKSGNRRVLVPRDTSEKEAPMWSEEAGEKKQANEMFHKRSPTHRRRQPAAKSQPNNVTNSNESEDRPVVELFNKSRYVASPDTRQRTQKQPTKKVTLPDRKNKKVHDTLKFDETTGPLENTSSLETKQQKDGNRHQRRVKYRSRRYELPTVASQMKQAGIRYYYGTANQTNIPFVISKSTAPSHNIGVNIQQVLNGLKIQQPVSGIPLTIAHHMGLGHIPTYGVKSVPTEPSLDNCEINAIKLGRRLVRLPSYKYNMSYNRLLTLYREGDGMVPRFLRSISRPHYFYTSMYNLAMNREDFDGATSKGRGASSHEAKQSLAEYANLYKEYEQIDKCLKEGNYEPEWERRRDELSRELAAREDHIRRVMQEYKNEADQSTLRASASNAEDGYRHSTFKLNVGDTQQ